MKERLTGSTITDCPVYVHISGHIMPLQLKETLQAIKPKHIFPIHGAHPELFSKFMNDLKSKITME